MDTLQENQQGELKGGTLSRVVSADKARGNFICKNNHCNDIHHGGSSTGDNHNE